MFPIVLRQVNGRRFLMLFVIYVCVMLSSGCAHSLEAMRCTQAGPQRHVSLEQAEQSARRHGMRSNSLVYSGELVFSDGPDTRTEWGFIELYDLQRMKFRVSYVDQHSGDYLGSDDPPLPEVQQFISVNGLDTDLVWGARWRAFSNTHHPNTNPSPETKAATARK